MVLIRSLLIYSVLCIFYGNIACAAEMIELHDALKSTYDANNEIKAAKEELGRVEADKFNAYTGFLPNVSFAQSRRKGDVEGRIQDVPNRKHDTKRRTRQFSVEQSLFEGGKTLFGVKAAEYGYRAQEAQYNATLSKVFTDAVTAYENVMMYRDILGFSLKSKKRYEKHLELANTRFKLGESTRTDVSQAKMRLSQAQSDVALRRGELAAAEANFERITGMKAPKNMHPIALKNIISMPKTYEQFIAVVNANNYDLMRYKSQLVAAQQGVRVSMSQFSPTVSVSANLKSKTKVDADHTNTATNFTAPYKESYKGSKEVILNVNVPIFQRGAEYFSYKKAKHAANSAEQQLLQAKKDVRSNAVSTWNGYRSFIAVIRSDLKAIKASEVAIEGLRTEVKAGTKSIIEVLDEESRLFGAKQKYRQDLAQQRTNVYRILQLMGALDLQAGSVKELEFSMPSEDVMSQDAYNNGEADVLPS